MLGVIAMNEEKTPYNPTPGDYDTDKLTDLHSPETNPSNYARNINLFNSSVSRSKDSYNSDNRNIKNHYCSDTTERIPTLAKYSDMNKDNDEFEKKGEI